MFSSEDNILIKSCGNLKDFLPEDSSRNALTKIEENTLDDFFAKVAHKQ